MFSEMSIEIPHPVAVLSFMKFVFAFFGYVSQDIWQKSKP